jgi:hypothetical protein
MNLRRIAFRAPHWVAVAALLLIPIAAMASNRKCEASAPTAESYTWEFPAEATILLGEIQAEAALVRQSADRLQSYARYYQVSPQSHAEQLDNVRRSVNIIGENLCRLQTIRHVTAPWQQRAIDHLYPSAAALARHVTAAISNLREKPHGLYVTDYENHIDSVYNYADSINASAEAFIEHAQLQDRLKEAREKLEVTIQSPNSAQESKEG